MEAEVAKPLAAAAAAASVSMSSASAASAGGAGGGFGVEFTADDLAAADQLVQLSVSGGGDDDVDQWEAFSSSSPRSVNNNAASAAAAARVEEEEEDSGVVDRRARKRYRLVSDLYDATKPQQVNKAGAGGKIVSKRKRSRDGVQRRN
jgi:hypothetical protein